MLLKRFSNFSAFTAIEFRSNLKYVKLTNRNQNLIWFNLPWNQKVKTDASKMVFIIDQEQLSKGAPIQQNVPASSQATAAPLISKTLQIAQQESLQRLCIKLTDRIWCRKCHQNLLVSVVENLSNASTKKYVCINETKLNKKTCKKPTWLEYWMIFSM